MLETLYLDGAEIEIEGIAVMFNVQ